MRCPALKDALLEENTIIWWRCSIGGDSWVPEARDRHPVTKVPPLPLAAAPSTRITSALICRGQTGDARGHLGVRDGRGHLRRGGTVPLQTGRSHRAEGGEAAQTTADTRRRSLAHGTAFNLTG